MSLSTYNLLRCILAGGNTSKLHMRDSPYQPCFDTVFGITAQVHRLPEAVSRLPGRVRRGPRAVAASRHDLCCGLRACNSRRQARPRVHRQVSTGRKQMAKHVSPFSTFAFLGGDVFVANQQPVCSPCAGNSNSHSVQVRRTGLRPSPAEKYSVAIVRTKSRIALPLGTQDRGIAI